MPSLHRLRHFPRPSLPLMLFCILLTSLWLAGGASRADALGQAVVRGASCGLLAIMLLFGPRPSFIGVKPVLAFLAMAIGLALSQIIPMPPMLWQALPGCFPLAEAAWSIDQPQPWRPLSIVPDATLNAAASLLVPFVTLLLIGGQGRRERSFMLPLLLGFVLISAMMGFAQLSGVYTDNIFINETRGVVSGTFANRNHFALFLAIGCVLAPAWSVSGQHGSLWRAGIAAGLIVLFLLTIVISGSRAGLFLGAAGASLGLLISGGALRRRLAHYPRWTFASLIAGILCAIALCLTLSILTGRAESITRLVIMDETQDLRARALPVILAMVGKYLPFGTGLGSFDPVFRMHEPLELLLPTYLNHAHDDFLEIAIEAGLPGILLLAAGGLWWALASVSAWRADSASQHILPKLGSAVLALIFAASAVDYPARTPMIMAVIVIAAVWLAGAKARTALP